MLIIRHRRSIENPWNFGDCMKGRIRFMTAITAAYAHAYQATCLTRHMPAVPHQNFRLPAQGQISVFSQCSFHNTWKRQWLLWMGYVYRWRCSRCWWWKLLLNGVCGFTIPSGKNRCHVWSRRHHRGSSRFLWCPKSLQQHRWNDGYDWSVVLSWSSWPVGPGWAVVHVLRFSAYCWSLLGHDPGSYTCATGTRVSKIHAMSPTQGSTHHATRVRSQW